MARLMVADTSTRATGVALCTWEKTNREPTLQIEAHQVVDQERMRAEALIDVLDVLYQEAECDPGTEDAYAVAVGPGSFTGLRIGVTMLKTMAQFTHRPIIGISTLQALAEAGMAQREADYYLPVIDARGNRIYAALFQNGSPGECQMILPEDLYLEEDFIARLQAVLASAPGAIFWCGEGLDRHPVLRDRFAAETAGVLEGEEAQSPIGAICRLAVRRLARGESDDALHLAPHYLRRSQAEMDRKAARERRRMPEGNIRPLKEDDLDALVALEQESFRKPWTREQLRTEMEQPFTFAFGREEGGRLTGYYFLSAAADEASLNRIAVFSEGRVAGRGTELLHHAMETAKSVSASEMFLEVSARNFPAQSLYRASGFVVTGRRTNYYPEEMADGLIMKRVLNVSEAEGGGTC